MTSPNQPSAPRLWPAVSPALKLFAIAFLTLLMTIPLVLIHGVLSEREGRRNEAVGSVANAWGGAQRIAGPYLIVPYMVAQRVEAAGKVTETQVMRYALYLPQDLETKVQVKTETRMRGIFQVPVYQAEMTIRGRFAPSDPRVAQGALQVLWNDAVLAVGIEDIRAIKAKATLTWGAAQAPLSFEPGIAPMAGDSASTYPGIHVRLPGYQPERSEAFEMALTINGTDKLSLVPLGQTTVVTMSADWPDPSFEGAYLPETRTITAQGFEAKWSIPHLARNLPQSLASAEPGLTAAEGTRFGVKFYVPVDFYQLVGRALKYGVLFVGTAFLVFFLAELMTRSRVHVIQYLMIGAAQVIFYLLLLAFAEHRGFDQAYAIAAAATVLLTGLYAATALGNWMRATIVLVVMAVVYGLLYLLLVEEDYALLIGSVTLFGMLAITMFVTRKLDWYQVQQEPPS